jgi:transposase InsO family protein
LRPKYKRLPVYRMCQLLEVSRALYYRKERDRHERERWEARLRDSIEKIILMFTGYGYRRVTRQLRREGWQVNHKRVLRVMREGSLLCRTKKRYKATTDSTHDQRVYPNLLVGLTVDSPNRVWVADITYVRLPSGFCYVAMIMDSLSRKVVGWHMSRSLDAGLCLAALEKALAVRRPEPGWIHHSDRGTQYASREYVERLKELGAQISMAGRGNPYQNAKAESFFRTLKREEVNLQRYEDIHEAKAAVGRYIDEIYNLRRLHSSIGYLSPSAFEQRLLCEQMGA